MGKPFEINCTIYAGEAVNSDNLNISWIGPNGVITNESNRITAIPTTSNGYIHTSTSTLQFSYISEEDKNVSYNCTASLSGEHKLLSKSFTMSNFTSKLIINYYYNIISYYSYIGRYTAKL